MSKRGREIFGSFIKFRSVLRSLIKSFGYDVYRLPYPNKEAFFDQKMLLSGEKELVIFDIGANVGNSAAKYRSLFPKSLIYSFEPFPAAFDKLCKKFEKDTSCKKIQMAIADKTGIADLYVNQFNTSNSLLPRPKSGPRYYTKGAEAIDRIKVSTSSIDDFCLKESIAQIHILKMDIQGAELMALRGAAGKLKEYSIALIYTEVMYLPHYEGGPMFHEICSFLSNYGYMLFDIYNNFYLKKGQLNCGDAIFVSPRILKRRN